MKRLRATLLTLTITGACLSLRTAAQSPGPEWPRFHGAANDNRSLETGLLKVWPDGGPKLLWTATGLGRGYSSVAVHQQRIYTAGMKDKQTEVIALDLDGKEVWRQINGQSWETDKRYAVAYAGSRGTPTCDGDRIYQLAEMGSLSAFDSATGRKVWTVDVLERFGGKTSKYGLSESVLVVGDRLFCCPAGEKGFLVCLDKATGATVWANREIPGSSSYVSLALTEIGGVMQIVGMSSAEAFGVDPKTGALLWTAEHGNQRKNNATNPIVYKGHVFVSTGYGKGSA
ncbi:MAG: PQQ-like beta-propeller repeat protein, partial [Lentisphaeria bacterium]|nr:PQQ-like beta-propeller repeat protein [Lentisphaeria bacterium]